MYMTKEYVFYSIWSTFKSVFVQYVIHEHVCYPVSVLDLVQEAWLVQPVNTI